MKKNSNHIATLLFLSFLLLPFMGMVILQGAQWYLKGKAADRMEHEHLVTISLSVEEVHWEKKEKELSIGGKLFDVKSYTLSGGILTATGFFDEKEISIVHFLSSLSSGKNNARMLQFFMVLQCFIMTFLLYSLVSPDQSNPIFNTSFPFHLPKPCCLSVEQPPRG